MKARILVVEDETIVQLDLTNRLEKLGHAVIAVASRGEEAVAKAVELEPDLVLMDVRLEGSMDGTEAARRIKAVKDIPVLYVTAYADQFTQGEALQPCLSKPFRTAELDAAIARTLAGSPQSIGLDGPVW